MAEQSKLSPPQERAILALLSNRDIRAAAEDANIAERTLYRWLSEETFKAAYADARRAAVQQGISRLQYGMSVATDTLIDVAADAKAPAAARVRAARSIADLALRAIELDDLLRRIEALERGNTNEIKP